MHSGSQHNWNHIPCGAASVANGGGHSVPWGHAAWQWPKNGCQLCTGTMANACAPSLSATASAATNAATYHATAKSASGNAFGARTRSAGVAFHHYHQNAPHAPCHAHLPPAPSEHTCTHAPMPTGWFNETATITTAADVGRDGKPQMLGQQNRARPTWWGWQCRRITGGD